MANKPLHPCRHAGCTALTTEKYCRVHAKQHYSGYFDTLHETAHADMWASWYKTPQWKVRRDAWLAAHPWCQVLGCHERATEVDHVEPHQGDWSRFCTGRIQSLCKRHHVQKTMRDVAGRRTK